jgi:hypothetical protein
MYGWTLFEAFERTERKEHLFIGEETVDGGLF